MPSKERMSRTRLTHCAMLTGCSKSSANVTHKRLTEILPTDAANAYERVLKESQATCEQMPPLQSLESLADPEDFVVGDPYVQNAFCGRTVCGAAPTPR